MGCGSSGTVVNNQQDPNTQSKVANGSKMSNGNQDNEDDLPTLVLPESPIQAKPRPEKALMNVKATTGSENSPVIEKSRQETRSAIAFEIPVEEFEGNRRPVNTPPAHLQRLLLPPQNDISLPDIEEKLAEAEQRRLSILQQRAVSAQNRTQKMMRSVHNMETMNPEHEITEPGKIVSKTLTIPQEPGVCEDKNIS